MLSLDYILEHSVVDGEFKPDALRAMLVTREDLMADHLRLAAQQFGLMPQIVAEVVAQLGLGTQPTEEERALIHQNFVALMEQIAEARRQAFGGEAPPPPPDIPPPPDETPDKGDKA